MFIPLILCDLLECVVENCDWIIYFFIISFAVYCFFILYVAAYMANKVVYIYIGDQDRMPDPPSGLSAEALSDTGLN